MSAYLLKMFLLAWGFLAVALPVLYFCGALHLPWWICFLPLALLGAALALFIWLMTDFDPV